MKCDISGDVTRAQDAQAVKSQKDQAAAQGIFFIQYILDGGVNCDVNDDVTGLQEGLMFEC